MTDNKQEDEAAKEKSAQEHAKWLITNADFIAAVKRDVVENGLPTRSLSVLNKQT